MGLSQGHPKSTSVSSHQERFSSERTKALDLGHQERLSAEFCPRVAEL